MNRFLFALTLLVNASLMAQCIEAGVTSKEFLQWKSDTTYVVLSSDNSAYNDAVSDYMTNTWSFNPVKFIDQNLIEKKSYRNAHKEKMVLHVVALSGAGSGSNNIKARKPQDAEIALALFQMQYLGNIGLGTPDIFVPVRKCFAYFSFLRKRGKLGFNASTESVFVTDFDKNPLHFQIPLALQYLENLTFLRQANSTKKYIFSHRFLKDINDMINQPKQLRKKTLVLMDVHLADLEKGDVKKSLRSKYEIVTPVKYHRLVAEKNPNYAVITGRSTRLGYLVTVFDLELGQMVYSDYGWGGKLTKKQLEDLKDTIRKGK